MLDGFACVNSWHSPEEGILNVHVQFVCHDKVCVSYSGCDDGSVYVESVPQISLSDLQLSPVPSAQNQVVQRLSVYFHCSNALFCMSCE